MQFKYLQRSLFGSVVSVALSTVALAAPKLHVIYNFAGGTDGASPSGSLAIDTHGRLYGATSAGGTSNDGTVFRVSPHGAETVLHVFNGGQDGTQPWGGVILDGAGNLYGTASGGGTNGLGVVFKLAPSGAETVLYTFQGICCGSDGSFPYSSLVSDRHGNTYGTTEKGGNSVDLGTVFRITRAGAETVLHAFSGGDGSYPTQGNLALGTKGTVYGITPDGGEYKLGIAFRMEADGTETVLHQFGTVADGAYPYGWVALDGDGNLYGTTYSDPSGDNGIVYKIDQNGNETIIHLFNGSDGAQPAGVTLIGKDLYGVTTAGGTTNQGTIFKIGANGILKVLHSFSGADGAFPICQLVADASGNLYGTTTAGGTNNDGVVFKLTLK